MSASRYSPTVRRLARRYEIARERADNNPNANGRDVIYAGLCASALADAVLRDLARERKRGPQPDARRLYDALLWALGAGDDFPLRAEGQGAYWWRSELQRRAGITQADYDRVFAKRERTNRPARANKKGEK